MCRFLCCSVQSVMSPKLHTKKQPFNWSDPEGDISAQLRWLELLFLELNSRCRGPSADTCHRLVETREFPRTFITRDYQVCFSVVYNSYHFRKKARLLLVESEISPFLPLFHIIILTLSDPGLPAVLFHTSFCHVSPSTLLVLCMSVVTSKALHGPGCIWKRSVSLISSISFLCYVASVFVVFIFICTLCNSHHHTIPSPNSLEGIEVSVPCGEGKGWK